MKMRVSKAGQVEIPPAIQDKAGIYPGAEVDMQFEDGAIVVRRSEPKKRVQEFSADIRQLRNRTEANEGRTARTLEEVEGLSRGEQFVQLLTDAGIGRMTTDEFMEMMRGPYEDLDPR
ncbi:MAG: AbrB/MazE/SpoVT family DNA-binding domain-containing protein [Pseudomonadota bacterium]|nr:AbrB/MazE/SpoVT family DNA-binding domain-containing protein [Pseudomonadota bacterium]